MADVSKFSMMEEFMIYSLKMIKSTDHGSPSKQMVTTTYNTEKMDNLLIIWITTQTAHTSGSLIEHLRRETKLNLIG